MARQTTLKYVGGGGYAYILIRDGLRNGDT